MKRKTNCLSHWCPRSAKVLRMWQIYDVTSANRTYPLYSIMLKGGRIHPEKLFRRFVWKALGELQTFTNTSRLPENIAKYQHAKLTESYIPLIASIREALSVVLTPKGAIPNPATSSRAWYSCSSHS